MSIRDVILIVPAAGQGLRLGRPEPKALTELGGRSLLWRTLVAFSQVSSIRQAVVLAPNGYEDRFRQELVDCPMEVEIHTGGDTRQESVRIGLTVVQQQRGADKGEMVAVHDAARCFVTPDLISRCIAAAREGGAATAALPAQDSVVKASDGQITGYLNRSDVWLVQTPQVFRLELLIRAHAQVDTSATDDAGLVQLIQPVRVVLGDFTNLKVTTPGDLKWAEKQAQSEVW